MDCNINCPVIQAVGRWSSKSFSAFNLFGYMVLFFTGIERDGDASYVLLCNLYANLILTRFCTTYYCCGFG